MGTTGLLIRTTRSVLARTPVAVSTPRVCRTVYATTPMMEMTHSSEGHVPSRATTQGRVRRYVFMVSHLAPDRRRHGREATGRFSLRGASYTALVGHSGLTLSDEVNGRLPRVRTCGDGSLCCDNDPQCCDGGGNGVFLDNKGQIADSAPSTTFSYGPERTAATFRTDRTTSTSATSATSTSAPKTTEASQETGTNGDDGDDDGGNDNAVKIGVGVAVPVAVLLIAGAGFFFWRRRKANNTPTNSVGDYTYGGIPKSNPHDMHDTPSPSMSQGYGGTQPPPPEHQPHIELENTQRQYNELEA